MQCVTPVVQHFIPEPGGVVGLQPRGPPPPSQPFIPPPGGPPVPSQPFIWHHGGPPVPSQPCIPHVAGPPVPLHSLLPTMPSSLMCWNHQDILGLDRQGPPVGDTVGDFAQQDFIPEGRAVGLGPEGSDVVWRRQQ